ASSSSEASPLSTSLHSSRCCSSSSLCSASAACSRSPTCSSAPASANFPPCSIGATLTAFSPSSPGPASSSPYAPLLGSSTPVRSGSPSSSGFCSGFFTCPSLMSARNSLPSVGNPCFSKPVSSPHSLVPLTSSLPSYRFSSFAGCSSAPRSVPASSSSATTPAGG